MFCLACLLVVKEGMTRERKTRDPCIIGLWTEYLKSYLPVAQANSVPSLQWTVLYVFQVELVSNSLSNKDHSWGGGGSFLVPCAASPILALPAWPGEGPQQTKTWKARAHNLPVLTQCPCTSHNHPSLRYQFLWRELWKPFQIVQSLYEYRLLWKETAVVNPDS